MRTERGFTPALLAALALGLIHALSLSVAGAWWLQWLAFGLFAALTASQGETHRRTRRSAALGFAFGLGWFVAGVCWLFISMHRYGGMPAPLAGLALLLFCAYLSIFPAAANALATWLSRARGAHPNGRLCTTALACALAGAFTLAELLRGWLFTGFPWLAPGYAHTDGPFGGLAPLVGVFGVGAAACLSAAFTGLAVRDALQRRTLQGAPLVIAIALAGVGWLAEQFQWETAATTPLHVDLIQGNVAQDMKFDATRARATMGAYADALQPGRAHLTVLPETAWTIPWHLTPPEITERIRRALTGGSRVAIGMPLVAQENVRQLTNSVAVIGPEGTILSRYDKTHLVPFGEFIPWGFRWFVAMMNIPLGDFGRGRESQPMLDITGHLIAFNICYEDLFGDELARQVRAGANLLINVSNIAWFGDSHAQEQHLQIARMRSRELARPMLRATNTGVTAAIDHRGVVLDRLPGQQVGALRLTITPTQGITPFARWANLPAWLTALALLVSASLLARRR